jgi:ABC transport system ATP-binding/permease protein
LKVLTEEQPADSGSIERGETLRMGVYDQLGIKITDPDQTMLEFVLESVRDREGVGPTEGDAEARSLLRRFEFPRQRWNERVSVLSGGEKRRLQMLSVLSQRPNCLLMDEPSVDCDLDTLVRTRDC